MKIAVDVDGVLAERVPAVLRYVDEQCGVTFEKDDIDDWDATESKTGKGLLEFFAETDEDPEHLLALNPVTGAKAGMERIQQDHEILIATYRLPSTRPITRTWLDRNRIPFDRYIEDIGDGKTNVSADLLIEDSPYTARQFYEAGGEVVLLSQPWNIDTQIAEIVPVATDWTEIVSIVDGMC